MISVRVAAAQVLLAVGRGRATLAAEVDRARAPFGDRRDRALLVELTAGALRWRNALDALIEAASRRSIANIEPRALAVLRIGVYQLRHLTRVPPHAILHESVEAVRTLGARGAAPFVNAVLRTVARRGTSLRLPGRPEGDDERERWIEYLTVSLSHPRWLVERWFDRYGAQPAEAWCVFNNSTPGVVVRPQPDQTATDILQLLRSHDIDATAARYVSDAIRLPRGGLGRLSREELERLHVQDEGSQLVARVAGARRGEFVLDLCASPGGKTMVMASDLGITDNSAATRLVAADHRSARVRLLAQTLHSAQLSVPIVRLDARRPLPFGEVFDAVLVDAPCSGLGTLSRDPDLKWLRTADQLAGFAADQRRMLRAAADAVRPGGRLIYATCSSEPEENIDVVEAFLTEDRRFSLEPVALPGVPQQLVDSTGCLMTLPFRDTLDAFFAAWLVRRNGT